MWAPVIGIKEEFTFVELLEFPIYVLKNHGDTWNGVPYSFWIILVVVAPLLINGVREFLSRVVKIGVIYPYQRGLGLSQQVRSWLYELALIGFVAAMLEEFVHLMYVYDYTGGGDGSGLWTGLFGVILLANGFPIVILLIIWGTLRYPRRAISSPAWAPLEIATGFSFLFLFGSGFYLGPGAMILAGLVRVTELSTGKVVFGKTNVGKLIF